jgi:hypothetical protein
VRADLATRVEFQLNSPALIFYPYKQRPALAGWIADERAATFVVQSHDGSPQPLEGYRLKEPDQIRREKLEREGLADEHAGARVSCACGHCSGAACYGSCYGSEDIPHVCSALRRLVLKSATS